MCGFSPGSVSGRTLGQGMFGSTTLLSMGVTLFLVAAVLVAPAVAPRVDPSGFGVGSVFAQTQQELDAEAALSVKRGLEYLAKSQNPDGSWTEKIGRKVHLEYRGTIGKHVGVTALCAMAFLSNGSLPDRGPYAVNVDRAIQFVLSCTQENGFITHQQSRMYSHAFATLFLAEVYGMTRMEKLRTKLKNSVSLIVDAQNKQGGWRYRPGAEDADMSITVTQVMALRAARNAGLHVPKAVIDNAIDYVRQSWVGKGRQGAFLYQHELLPNGAQQRSRATFPLTAAGVVALLGAGEYDNEMVQKGLFYLEANRPLSMSAYRTFDYYYGMYYATQGMFQRGGQQWDRWQRDVWRDLFSQQKRQGNWEDLVGPNYATAMACIILQIPLQYLPIFER